MRKALRVWQSNERTGTPLNFLWFSSDIVFEMLLCRLLYRLILRNLAQLCFCCVASS